MNSESKDGDVLKKPSPWMTKVCDALEKAEGDLPAVPWMQGDWPSWVKRAMQEILKAYVPDARLKPEPAWTPRALGAAFGTKIGVLERAVDENGFLKSEASAAMQQPVSGIAKADTQATEADVAKVAEQMTDQLARIEILKVEVFSSIATAPRTEQLEFLSAYIDAMQRGEQGLDGTNTGTTATPIYIYLVTNWQLLAGKNTAELHKICVQAFSASQVGELKTFQKLCQRIGYKAQKAGRPKKKR